MTGDLPVLNVNQVHEKLSEVKIIDVRRPDEFTGELGHIKGANLATLESGLEEYLKKISKDDTYVFVCRSGGRSGAATELARGLGFKKVYNMLGGMTAWNVASLPVEK